MNIEEFNNQKRILEEESYRAIRRKISDFSDDSNNDEIAGFVKGVISLETLLFNDLENAGNRLMHHWMGPASPQLIFQKKYIIIYM